MFASGRRLVTGVAAASLVLGVLAGVFATAASAATPPASCAATSPTTTTCTVTLHLTSGTWTAHNTTGATAPTAFPATATAGFAGTEDPSTGAITGTLTFPATPRSTSRSKETILFYETTPGSAKGQVTTTGTVTVSDVLTIEVHITSPVTYQCISSPVDVKFESTAPYSASTGGKVTLTASGFTVPDFASTDCAAAAATLDKTFSGSTGNALTLNLAGTLVVPEKPTKTSTTTLTASPPSGNVAGQTTTLTATVEPSGATGSVAFLSGTTALGTVTVTSGTAVLTTSALPPGSDQLQADYSGNGTYLPSTGTLSYKVATAPTFNVNYPSSVVLGAAPTDFAGAVGDPVGGPTLAHVRLDFALSGITRLKKTEITLESCTAGYASCSAITLTGGPISATKSLTGEYGGTTGFSLIPGQQIPLYFEISVKSGSNFGRLTVAASLVTVTASGTAPTATLAQSSNVIDLTLTSPQTTTLTGTAAGADGSDTYQGYSVTLKGSIAYGTSNGPAPTGTLTIERTSTVTGTVQQTSLGAFPVTSKSPTVELNTATWPLRQSTVTFVYSGDPFYDPSTSATVPFTIKTPPAGPLYVCTVTGITGVTSTTVGAIVTGISTVQLPATATAGATVPVSFTAHLAIDANTTYQTTGKVSSPIVASFGLSPSGMATTVLPTGLAPGRSPLGVALDPTTHTLYVAAFGTDSVYVVTADSRAIETTVPVGENPRGVAYDPGNHTVYVTNFNSNSNSVSAITATTNTVAATIPVGGNPNSVAVDRTTHTVYVVNNGSHSVSVITATTNTVVGTPITLGTAPSNVAVDPATDTVYVTLSSSVTVITGSSRSVTGTISVKDAAAGQIAVDPTTGTLYVPEFATKSLAVVTLSTKTVKTVTVGTYPDTAGVDPTTGLVYVGLGPTTTGSVVVLTGSTDAPVGSPLAVGAKPQGVAVDPASGAVYVSNKVGGTVAVVTGGTTPTLSGTVALTASATTVPSTKLAAAGTFTLSGEITLPTTPGTTTVGLPTITYERTLTGIGGSGDFVTTWTCAPRAQAATVGTIDVLAPAKPSVTAQPASQTVNVGTTATFTATASGEPAATVQWQSSANGTTWTNITGATMGTQSGETTTATYTTPPATAADNGMQYRAVFTNGSGTVASTPATLTVDVPPVVTTQPADVSVTVGTPATFTAAATARPAPSVRWQVSTDTGTTFTDVPGATAPTLTVTPRTATSGNEYRAVFTNTLGKATSTPATLTVTTTAYRLAGADGAIYDFGSAQFHGSMGDQPLNEPIVGMADTPAGGGAASDGTASGGYWEVASDGGIFTFGDAQFYGSTGAMTLNQPIVGMAPTPDGGGYWLVASDGGIFAFGDAQFFGSMGGQPLNKPIVGMAATPDGGGYWLVASDGGIFAFGDAPFYGSTGSLTLNKPIVGMAATPTGGGYWLVASDGGIFSFGDAAFYGSAAGSQSSSAVVAITTTPDGQGYWLAGADGSVTGFGDAALAGSMAGRPLNAPVVGMTG